MPYIEYEIYEESCIIYDFLITQPKHVAHRQTDRQTDRQIDR